MPSGRVLIVDDDKNLLELLAMRLESAGCKVVTATKGNEALEEARNKVFDLSIADLRLADRDGISLMEELHSIMPDMPVIILTAHGSVESAVDAMKKGAYTYVTKPFESQELLMQVQRALENRRLSAEVKRLEGLLQERYDFQNIVARSEKMQRILEVISRIAKTESTVYIQGESGTGKDLIAKAIHLASDRKQGPFVAINCAAIPETLLESELFGHERGAFTGAVKSTKGLFSQAHQGTIFLDEIGDMPPSIQAKLLRVIQERQFLPLGSERPIEVDVRIIVATNKDLEELAQKGLFREDLFYRIHVIPIVLPPLRERKEDISLLVETFLKRFSEQMQKDIKGLTSSALQKLMLHDWPGNVRELENALEYAVAMTQEDRIGDDLILPARHIIRPAMPTGQSSLKPFREAREDFEKQYLTQVLELSAGNVTQAAKLAGKYRADFYALLKKHHLSTDGFKNRKKERAN